MQQTDKFRIVAIVILTYNNLEYSKRCLESIRKHTASGTYEIVVVDNDSTDGTKEWLSEQTDIKLQINETNEGFPKGCNIGIGLAGEDCDILLLNNDTIVTPNWLCNLQACLYSDGKIGAAGAVCNHNENLQGADFYYEDLDKMEALAEQNNISDSKRWEEKIFLIGFCILIKREILREIGPLDEMYSPGYIEDNDLCLRMICAGYRLMLCHDCFIHHYLGSGFRKDLSKFYPVLYANRAYFINKWGFETFAFDDVQFASLRIMGEPDKFKKINVLEFDCGIGVTLLKIKYEYPNAELFGLEKNKNKALIAGHIANVSVQKEDLKIDLPEAYFDYILIGNRLETVDDPEAFLTEISKYMKPGGFIIGTVQNMMHYHVIQSILGGNWLYASQSIVNKHNRTFYTYDDILRVSAKCGFKNPFVFHWFSVPSEEDRAFIRKISEAGQQKREYLYTTYLYSFKLQK